ncbi:hypothetical protein Tco_0508570 [Tanacetum coccineum]
MMLENRCGYLARISSSRSYVNLEFHLTLTIGMHLRLSCFTSRSIISTDSSTHDKLQTLIAGVPIRLLALAMAAVYAFRAAVKSAVSCRMTSKVMAGVSDVDVLLGGILSTQDNAYYGMIHEDGDNDTNDGDDDGRER